MESDSLPPPTNSLVGALLTDMYQITMAYAYWKAGRHNDRAVFELFFRKNPFEGEYTVFCGLDECLKFLTNFKFNGSDLEYLKSLPSLSHCDPRFFDEYLANLDCGDVQLYSMLQGTVAFPRVPLMTVVGPLGVGQIIETTLLNLVNFPSLVATNASRMVMAARALGKKPFMAEFGLRRAQGPDGGFTASKYSVLGGFDGTSNIQAGKLLGIPIVGTNAHAFVQTHKSLDEVKNVKLKSKDGSREVEILPLVLKYRVEVMGTPSSPSRRTGASGEDPSVWRTTNDGELASFITYAAAFPDNFLCIVDTYDTLESGVRNFILVSLVLDDLGYVPRGIRLDSGDLAYFSVEAAAMFEKLATRLKRPFLNNIDIVASNDLNESTLHALNRDGHAINTFGVGTNLVTCQQQPALGCVYKLAELNGVPRMKLSNDIAKVLIPGSKIPYRLYGEQGWPLVDLMTGKDEPAPEAGKRVLCRHPFVDQKRVAVISCKVKNLHELVFDRQKGVVLHTPSLLDSRKYVMEQLKTMRPDILRFVDPGEYKVAVTDEVFSRLHSMWQSETPVMELR